MSLGRGPRSLCHVLREDPELAECIPLERRRQAVDELVVREVDVPSSGDPAAAEGLDGGGIGLLLLGGLLIRRVGIRTPPARFGAELIGEGDLLRPWRDEQDSPMLPLQTGWLAVSPARMAVLDEAFVESLAAYPELATGLVARAMQRARNLAVQMAIVHQARVQTRLHMLLWHLAGRWGRVRTDATVLPLRLTHVVLAELVAARRQTVTSALSDLTRRRLLQPEAGVWLLHGGPPSELLDLDDRPADCRPVRSPSDS